MQWSKPIHLSRLFAVECNLSVTFSRRQCRCWSLSLGAIDCKYRWCSWSLPIREWKTWSFFSGFPGLIDSKHWLHVYPIYRRVECKLLDVIGQMIRGGCQPATGWRFVTLCRGKSYAHKLFCFLQVYWYGFTVNKLNNKHDSVFTTQLCCSMLTVQCTVNSQVSYHVSYS